MSEWTRAGDVDPGVTMEPAIGDLWITRKPPMIHGHITDVVPVKVKDEKPLPVRRVCVLTVQGGGERREWMDVAELRKRFIFRRRA